MTTEAHCPRTNGLYIELVSALLSLDVIIIKRLRLEKIWANETVYKIIQGDGFMQKEMLN